MGFAWVLWWLAAAPRVKIERFSKDGWEAAVAAGGKFPAWQAAVLAGDKFRPCVAKGAATDEWCDRNCNSIPPNCDSERCKCSKWNGCVSLNGSNRTNLWCTAQRECGINGPPHSECSNALDQYTNERLDLNKLCKCHAPAVYATPPTEEEAQPSWQLTQRGAGQQQEWHDGMDFQPAVAAPAAVATAPDPQWQQPQLPAAEGAFDDGTYHGDQAQPQLQQPVAAQPVAAQPVPPQPQWQEPKESSEEIRQLKEEIRQKREAERQARKAEKQASKRGEGAAPQPDWQQPQPQPEWQAPAPARPMTFLATAASTLGSETPHLGRSAGAMVK